LRSEFARCVYTSVPVFSVGAPASDDYTLSLHDALPISGRRRSDSRPTCCCARWWKRRCCLPSRMRPGPPSSSTCPMRARPHTRRSEEHTSELQSRGHLVCRLLLEKKNKPASL